MEVLAQNLQELRLVASTSKFVIDRRFLSSTKYIIFFAA